MGHNIDLRSLMGLHNMKLYHGTNEENWNNIIKHGFLMSPTGINFLSITKEYAKVHGSILLEIDYEPTKDEIRYADFLLFPVDKLLLFGSFQVETKNKIYLKDIKRLE